VASFDALLQLLVAQGAESLTLVGGAVPELSKNGETTPLSMPPLAGETLTRFVGEVREAVDGGRYLLDAKGERVAFDVVVESDARLHFRLAAVDLEGCAQADAPGAAPPSTLALASQSSSIMAPPAASRAEARVVEQLLARALELEATDLFLSTSADARVRAAGRLEEMAGTRCTRDAILSVLGVDAPGLEQLAREGSVDLGVTLAGGRVRANVFLHKGGVAAAIRPIRRVRSLAELGLPVELAELTAYKDGLVLLVGPAGSGKSSTLAALIQHLNRTRACHVVTIEDPIEFEYEPGRGLINQRQVGDQADSFHSALRASLRQSPDVILLGEMRDPETIAAALTAAETGHLVLSTLHSGGADMAVDRIIDAFPPHQQGQVRTQLAGVLRVVVTQLLLPGLREAALVPALEKMVVTHAIAHSIRESRGHQISSHIQTGRAEGMVSLEMSLAALVKRRLISRETAIEAARNVDVMTKLLAF
jgi:twitching motility protein PilT